MANGPWIMAGQVLALEHWRPNFSAGTDSVNTATLWMRLPDLPMEMWDRSLLLRVASAMGVPKFIDNCTEEAVRGGYAKDCVQVDLSRPLRPGVDIVASGKRRWRQFKYENIPILCFMCGRVGHLEEECSRIDPEEVERRKKAGSRLYGPWMVISRVPVAGATVRKTGKEPDHSLRPEQRRGDGDKGISVNPTEEKNDGWQSVHSGSTSRMSGVRNGLNAREYSRYRASSSRFSILEPLADETDNQEVAHMEVIDEEDEVLVSMEGIIARGLPKSLRSEIKENGQSTQTNLVMIVRPLPGRNNKFN
ncbi:hypothetical protein COCNU_01G006690 [Cocos nucifera]|uniref:CCHC-type domain-containing protein n=1 Tax=Cocos nucifera TaxID=13894 RepID=A0A8K0HV55_COCNU|nr:hypothetical protein COCNU_01G006690 [Cocos nucifera]